MARGLALRRTRGEAGTEVWVHLVDDITGIQADDARFDAVVDAN